MTYCAPERLDRIFFQKSHRRVINTYLLERCIVSTCLGHAQLRSNTSRCRGSTSCSMHPPFSVVPSTQRITRLSIEMDYNSSCLGPTVPLTLTMKKADLHWCGPFEPDLKVLQAQFCAPCDTRLLNLQLGVLTCVTHAIQMKKQSVNAIFVMFRMGCSSDH